MRIWKIGLAALAVMAPLALAEAKEAPAKAGEVCAECVRAHMVELTSPAMQGRQCGTAGDAAAARYLEAQFQKAGIKPAYPGGHIQAFSMSTGRLAADPVLEIAGAQTLRWTHGKEFVLLATPKPASGRLVRLTSLDAPPDLKGAVVFYDSSTLPGRPGRAKLYQAGAVAVIEIAPAQFAKDWGPITELWRETTVKDAPGDPSTDTGPRIFLRPDLAEALRATPAGTAVAFNAPPAAPEIRASQNVIGVVRGTDPDADRNAILLSAHYDHLGVQDGVLYPGADDDASGTTAVLEFARVLGAGAAPRRTVYLALFSCEEEGGLGATYFRAHPPTALTDIAVNMQFEMIGLRDPKHPETLMLTGWERSNLGPSLAAQGARIGPDPYPDEHFFERSDNYALAKRGVVAHTVSAWPNPPLYHQPTDTLEAIDLPFMTEVIQSLVGPIRWLADGDFKPAWVEGQKP